MRYYCFSVFIALSISSFAQIFQKNDKAIFSETTPGYYENVILKDNAGALQMHQRRFLSMEFMDSYPVDLSVYNKTWHTLPISQGNTGTCWCFAATSFLESEIYRQHNRSIDLSEMYFVYWEYVDRAIDFVETRGQTYFEQGSEANAIKRLIPKYGAVPVSAYPGKPKYRQFHYHEEMLSEMKQFLSGVKQRNEWNKESVTSGIRKILDKHMGEIPESFEYDGKTYTPISFYSSLDTDIDDMYSFMSTLSVAYNQKSELVEPDNWWKSDDYYNVSLDDFYFLIENAINNSYSVCICGDVSEPGHNAHKEVAIVPDFDIPAEYINESSRELRLYNGATTDDHCIHLVGIYQDGDNTWFLAKDSGSGAFDGKNKGYRFYHEDYIRLKMMNIMLHKTIARPVLDKIIK
jgi:bleomycin hydrolase